MAAKQTGSIAVALVVGAAIGFVGGRAVSPKTAEAPAAAAVADAAKPTPAPAARPGAADTQIFNVPFDDFQPTKGAKDAKVTIIEVSDFECPFCNRVNPTVKQILEAYPNDVKIVWANNPLGFHKNAMPAAKAAYAAHQQGKFWEFHDKAFANQRALTAENFETWAKELGLDMAKFKADMASPKIEEQIKKEQALYTSRGARGTPGFFINGRLVSGAQPFDNFKRVIDEEIKRADAELAKGTSKDQLYGKLIAGGLTTPPAPAARPEAAPAKPVFVEVPKDAPTKGPADAKVTIVEFSEFECPFCSRVNPTVKQIEETYGKDVRIVFRHLPLPFHKNAVPAAEASMAAHAQGKFWEFHDKAFANQRALTRENFEKWGQEIGLDMKKFKADLDSGKYKARVEQDRAYAGTVGARGTPAFFINGKLVSGAQPFDNFKKVIDEEIKRADAEIAKGTPKAQLYQKLAGN
ncbi:DsbA family protein [Vulgatibacter sp.]|uniref:DsbA family protein n=1 Tax=Vulgatibacter sp. TaxID=1971226 RepID=UPI00356237E0